MLLKKEAEEFAPKMVKEKPDLDLGHNAILRVRPNKLRG